MLTDALRQLVLRLIAAAGPAFAWCTVMSYDDVAHTAQVTLHTPASGTFPSVPVMVPWRGVRLPHYGGMQGACLLLNGVPQILLGITYTTHDVVPARGLMLEESLVVIGDVTVAGGLYLGEAMEIPPAIPLYKYAMVTVTERPASSPTPRAAQTYQCLPSANGALNWVLIASGL